MMFVLLTKEEKKIVLLCKLNKIELIRRKSYPSRRYGTMIIRDYQFTICFLLELIQSVLTEFFENSRRMYFT